MYVCVCMNVCTYLCKHECMYVYMYICIDKKIVKNILFNDFTTYLYKASHDIQLFVTLFYRSL